MTHEYHQFSLGNYTCTVINDGYITMGPTSIFFDGASEADLETVLAQHDISAENMRIPCSCMLIDTGEHRVLVDCGAGPNNTGGYDADLGYVLPILEEMGVGLETITHVILSHGHFDHIAAIVSEQGMVNFPNARYVMAAGEHDYWMNDPENDGSLNTQKIRRGLRTIHEQLDLVADDAQVVDGISLISTPGHTHHHVSIMAESEGETLICIIDVMDHPLQTQHPTWGANWDLDRAKSTDSRKKILELAAETGAIVHGFHFPFPGLGTITNDGDVWQWQSST